MRTLILLALAVLAMTAAPARAQDRQTGTLRGVSNDPSGAVIPNAMATLKGTDTANRNVTIPAVTSDGQGVASAPDVPPGRYAVTASFPGFESRTLSDVRVRAGDNRREITLPIE